MKAELTKVKTREEHKLEGFDVFLVFILSHGIQGKVYGIDSETVTVDEIVDIFDGKNCEQFKGKPKLFFFQACQEGEFVAQ